MSQIQFVRNLFSSSFKLHSEHFLVPPQPLRLFEPPFTPLTIIARPHSLPALSLLPAVFTLDKSEPLKSATSRHHSTKKKKKRWWLLIPIRQKTKSWKLPANSSMIWFPITSLLHVLLFFSSSLQSSDTKWLSILQSTNLSDDSRILPPKENHSGTRFIDVEFKQPLFWKMRMKTHKTMNINSLYKFIITEV